ncbi:hypothetical protein [Methanosarcina sp. KYL-1]|uniref:hypothetical protein n=1 Tax=Methanosarcina sp. KYL-1 TaxID=2602068 RepID=UPI0021012CB9|nr:hypothetical protein [Methanosarcina sp. KYL-1]
MHLVRHRRLFGCKCAGDKGTCHQPNLRRLCLVGLRVRMDKTLEKLGTPLQNFSNG